MSLFSYKTLNPHMCIKVVVISYFFPQNIIFKIVIENVQGSTPFFFFLGKQSPNASFFKKREKLRDDQNLIILHMKI